MQKVSSVGRWVLSRMCQTAQTLRQTHLIHTVAMASATRGRRRFILTKASNGRGSIFRQQSLNYCSISGIYLGWQWLYYIASISKYDLSHRVTLRPHMSKCAVTTWSTFVSSKKDIGISLIFSLAAADGVTNSTQSPYRLLRDALCLSFWVMPYLGWRWLSR